MKELKNKQEEIANTLRKHTDHTENCKDGACDVPKPFLEREPTVLETLKDLAPGKEGTLQYLKDVFPCLDWMPRYNWRWLLGDGIAGLTVGLVVIPQAMAYALLANLSPEFGLYTSFVGAVTYWLFGTSRDIVIGVRLSDE